MRHVDNNTPGLTKVTLNADKIGEELPQLNTALRQCSQLGNISYPRLIITYVSIHDLEPNPANPRIHSEKQIQEIALSIKTFGFLVPVVIDCRSRVVAGHGRLLGAKLVGMTELPAIRLEHLTDVQAKAFMLADNKLTENSKWDHKLLGEQLKALTEVELDFSLEVTGFEVGEIDVLIEGLEPANRDVGDSADALAESELAIGVCRSGDLWFLERNRVFCGNSLNQSSYAAAMNGQRAAVVFADPPYNVSIPGHATGLGKLQHRNFEMAVGEMNEAEFTDFLTQLCTLLARYSVDGSIHFLCIDWRHIRELLTAGRHVFSELKNICVWVKDNGGMGSLYRSQHELICVFKSGKERHRNNVQLGQYGRYRTNVWQYAGMNSFSRSTEEGNLLDLHPTVKPVALVADAIMDCSGRNDIVLDPFLGSGTTVIAAERTGRICYGIEIDPLYVDTTIRRWQKFTGLSATHGLSGRSFNDLEREMADEPK